MGNSDSSSRSPASLADRDIEDLGRRFPFGDTELQALYAAYGAMAYPGSAVHRVSFWSDWARAIRRPGRDAAEATVATDTALLLRVCETKILTPDLGTRLYRAAFWVPGDVLWYGGTGQSQNPKSLGEQVNAVPLAKDGSPEPTTSDEYTRKARLERTFEGLTLSSRKGSGPAVKVLFDALALDPHAPATLTTVPTRIRAFDFVTAGYRLAMATAFLAAAAHDNDDADDMAGFLPEADSSGRDAVALRALAQSLTERARMREARPGVSIESPNEDHTDDHVELEDVYDWIDAVAPLFASILPTFWHQILFPHQAYPPSRTAFSFPRVPCDSVFFESTSSPTLFTLGCLSKSLTGVYYRLYTSASDGLSFNRLQNALLGYSGPTLLLIRTTGGAILGAFTASAWKESRDFYGNTDCFLFSAAPVTAVYRPTGTGRNFMYCNSFARSRGYDQQAHGIGFGGTVDEPRLFLSESFDACRAGAQDCTFANGSLLPRTSSGAPQTNFELDAVEVWGVGGDDVVDAALGQRQKARALREEGIRRARKVDKAQFLDDFRSGLMDSKAFQHRQQMRGRADVDCEERATKQYEYEK